MSPNNPIETLCQHTLRLLDLILQERQALQDHDLDRMGALLGVKEERTQEIMRIELGLRQQLEREGLSMNAQGISAWMQRQRLDLAAWRRLRIQLHLLQDLHGINGHIVSRAERNTQKLLEILTGQPDHSVYRRDGMSRGSRWMRAYGSA